MSDDNDTITLVVVRREDQTFTMYSAFTAAQVAEDPSCVADMVYEARTYYDLDEAVVVQTGNDLVGDYKVTLVWVTDDNGDEWIVNVFSEDDIARVPAVFQATVKSHVEDWALQRVTVRDTRVDRAKLDQAFTSIPRV